MPDWYSTADAPAQARLDAAWAGAPLENVELCGFILDTAKLQVIEFAPEATDVAEAVEAVLSQFGLSEHLEAVLQVLDLDAAPVPFNYVLAQLQQAKNLWAAGRADQDGNIGTEGYSFTPRPLDKTIRGMIRPTNGDVGGGF